MCPRYIGQHGGIALHVPKSEASGPGELQRARADGVFSGLLLPVLPRSRVVRQQMAWCEKHLQNTLGRDIEDKLAASDDNGNGYGNGGYNGNGDNGYNGNGDNGNGFMPESIRRRTRH